MTTCKVVREQIRHRETARVPGTFACRDVDETRYGDPFSTVWRADKLPAAVVPAIAGE
jgi:hypothetical protein